MICDRAGDEFKFSEEIESSRPRWRAARYSWSILRLDVYAVTADDKSRGELAD